MRSEYLLPSNRNYIKEKWEPSSWNKISSIESILTMVKYLLGSKLGNGVKLKIHQVIYL